MSKRKRDPVTMYRSRAYTTAKYLGDFQAVRKGKYVERFSQRILGKYSRRAMNKGLGPMAR